MLVLTRKSQQQVIIGDDIRLIVLDIRGGRVKVGLTAPDEVDIRRKEAAAQSGNGSSARISPWTTALDGSSS